MNLRALAFIGMIAALPLAACSPARMHGHSGANAPRPTTYSLQDSGDWKRSPHVRAFYDLTVATFANGPDIDVDAYPNAHITGRVREIQGGAAAVFSLFPQSNTGGNFQKVTQVIPVKIALDAPPTVDLVPGMNVTVHIHKH